MYFLYRVYLERLASRANLGLLDTWLVFQGIFSCPLPVLHGLMMRLWPLKV
jgi:hypothetical protein